MTRVSTCHNWMIGTTLSVAQGGNIRHVVTQSSMREPSHHGVWMLFGKPPGDDGVDASELEALKAEANSLQTQLSLIEALEQRNKAQLETFVDQQDQWDSMEREERELLQQRDAIARRLKRTLELVETGEKPKPSF